MGATIRRSSLNQKREELTHPRLNNSANAEMFGAGNARTAAMNARGWSQMADGIDDLGDVASGIAINERRQDAIEAEKLRRENEVAANKMQRETEAIQRRKRDLEFDDMKLGMLERMNQRMDGGKSANITGVSRVNKVNISSKVNNLDKGLTGSGFTGEGDNDISQTRSENIRAIAREEWENAQNGNYSEEELYGIKKKINSFLFSNLPGAIKEDRAFQAKRKVDLVEADLANDVEGITRSYDDKDAREDLLNSYELKVAELIGRYEKNPDIGRQKLKAYMGKAFGSIVQKYSNEGRYEEALQILRDNRYRMNDMDAEGLETTLEKNLEIQKANQSVLDQEKKKNEILQEASSFEYINNPVKQAEFLNSQPHEWRKDIISTWTQNESLNKSYRLQKEQDFSAKYSKQCLKTGIVLPYLETENGRVQVDTELFEKMNKQDNFNAQNDPQIKAGFNKFMKSSDKRKANLILGNDELAVYGAEWFDQMVTAKTEAKARIEKLKNDNDAFKDSLPSLVTDYATEIYQKYAEDKKIVGGDEILMNNFINIARLSGVKDSRELMDLAKRQIHTAEFDSTFFGYDKGTIADMNMGIDIKHWQEMEDEPAVPLTAIRALGGKVPKGTAWDGKQRVWRLPNGKCIDLLGNVGISPKVNGDIYRPDKAGSIPADCFWSVKEDAYINSRRTRAYNQDGQQIKVK